jgi:hypothetical protein
LKPQLLHFGNGRSPVVLIDDFTGGVDDFARLAEGLAPFPPEADSYYPGLRRMISEADRDAFAYVQHCCRGVAPFIGGAFDVKGFALLRASFSMVTLQPDELRPVQRVPHFDSPDQSLLAMLHYLRVPAGSGTAFYRHRATGVERVTDENIAHFVPAMQTDAALLPKDSGYMHGSNAFYEQIGAVEAVPDRLLIYHGSLLHSGIIPPGMNFSADPREGRLTGNFFLQAR